MMRASSLRRRSPLRLLPIAVLLVAGLAVFFAPTAPAQAQTQYPIIWSATLTLTVDEGSGWFGCHHSSLLDDCSAALSPHTFSYALSTYGISFFYYDDNNDELGLQFTDSSPGVSDTTRAYGILSLDGTDFALANDALNDRFRYRWRNVDLSWTDGQTVSVMLRAPLYLNPNSVTATGATLTLADYSGTWYYKADKVPHTACSAAQTGATATLTGLTPDTDYTYKAYSNRDCTDELTTNESGADFVTVKESKVIWSATLTVDEDSGILGCGSPEDDDLDECSTALSEDEFSYRGTTSRILWLYYSPSTPLAFTFHQFAGASGGIEPRGILIVDGTKLPFATRNPLHAKYTWRNHGLTWTDGQTVSVSLMVPVGLSADMVTATSARLTIADHTGTWYYKANRAPHTGCSAAQSGTTATLTGLTPGVAYTYKAYSNSGCTAELTSNVTDAHLATSAVIWSATLTADLYQVDSSNTYTGCDKPEIIDCSMALSTDTFTYGGTTYTVRKLVLETSNGGSSWSLSMIFDRELPDVMQEKGTLTLGGTAALPFKDGTFTLNPTTRRHSFTEPTIPAPFSSGFSDNQRVRVSITAPTPLSAPANLRATTPARRTLSLRWNAVPGATDYRVDYRLAGYGYPWTEGITTTETRGTLVDLYKPPTHIHQGWRWDGQAYDVSVTARSAADQDLNSPWTVACFSTNWDDNDNPNTGNGYNNYEGCVGALNRPWGGGGSPAGSPANTAQASPPHNPETATVNLSASPNPVAEGAELTVAATLSAALDSRVIIRLFAGGTGGFDTVPNIVIPAGQTRGSGAIAILTDEDGNDETFTVAVDTESLPESVTAGDTTSVTITVTDTDRLAAPGPVSVTHNGSSLSASWAAVSGATKYDVEYQASGATTWTSGATDHTATSLTISSGVGPGKSYTVRVKAKNDGGASDWTTSEATAPAPPPAPTSVAAAPFGTVLGVSWIASARAAGYDVEYRESGASSWSTGATDHTGTILAISGIDAVKSYLVRVKAKNAGGESAWATPATPDAVDASSISVTHNGSSLTVSWDAPDGATKYDVTYQGNGVDARAAWNRSGATLTITCDIRYPGENRDCVSGAHGYTVGIRSRNDIGGESGWVYSSPPARVAAQDAVDASSISVTHNGSSLTVSWDAPSGATHYDVTYQGNGVDARAAWNRAGTTLTITCDIRAGYDNCVSSQHSYTVGIRARNSGGGESGWVYSSPPASHTEGG